MPTITPTGNTLLDATLGVTDKEWLMDGLGGLSAVPSEELTHIFDIGAGDGLWSKVATTYAANARVVSIDWRLWSVTTPAFEHAVLSIAERVWVPARQFAARDGILITDLLPIKGFTLDSLLKEYHADPSKTAIRYQGLVNIPAFLTGLDKLRMFTGALYGPSGDMIGALDLLRANFKEFNLNQKGDVYYVRAYNQVSTGNAVSGSELGGVSDCDAAGDWTVGDRT